MLTGFVVIRPDYVIEIRNNILIETDVPMPKHGLSTIVKKLMVQFMVLMNSRNMMRTEMMC
jgi:hypothetical protein